jgi:hypothetical protein
LFTANQPRFAPPKAQTRLTLGELADATGGGFRGVLATGLVYEERAADELVPTLASVVEELRHQYALGFVPSIATAPVRSRSA